MHILLMRSELVRRMHSHGFAIVTWCHTHHVLEGPVEGIIVRVTHFLTDLLNSLIRLLHEQLGFFNAMTNEQIHKLLPNLILEKLTQILRINIE